MRGFSPATGGIVPGHSRKTGRLRCTCRTMLGCWFLGIGAWTYLPANIWFSAATPGRAWWSRMTAIPASFSHLKPSRYKQCKRPVVPTRDQVGVQDDAFHLWGRILPLLRGVQRASSQALAHIVRKGVRDSPRSKNLTGMRTVFMPNPFKRQASSSVNHVCQCSSKTWSAVYGFALVRSLLICWDRGFLVARDNERTIRT